MNVAPSSPSSISNGAKEIGCCPIRPSERLREMNRQLQERLDVECAESSRLGEQLASLESSLAWAIARRLSRLRRLLAPEGSRRLACLKLGVRGWRLFRRQGVWRASTRAVGKLARRLRGLRALPTNSLSAMRSMAAKHLGQPYASLESDRTEGASVPTPRKFRVAFIGSDAREFQSMRYRAHHLIEALAFAGQEALFVPEEDVGQHLPLILSHDVIVLVRVLDNETIAALIDRARWLGIPTVYDIDDYVFDPWVLPYVESYRCIPPSQAISVTNRRGKCLDRCDYFTASTAYLVETVQTRGKKSFLLRNGLNAAQMHLSRLAEEQRRAAVHDGHVRIGYFSGTRTHQADFRIVYPALMQLLRDEDKVRLVVGGYLNLNEFPGLAPFADRIDILPPRDWRELPAAIATVDINLIPLELTPFNEGKSNLKYYEAGVMKIPSVASPTRILRDSITHGYNGLLARTADEWYDGLMSLVARADLRERMGQNAFDRVMDNYTPTAVSIEAVQTYQQLIGEHRSQRGIAEHALTLVILLRIPQDDWDDAEIVLARANELAALGHAVTVRVSNAEAFASSVALKQFIAKRFFAPLFSVQLDGEVPCCDVLMATDAVTADMVRAIEHRAHLAISLVCDPKSKDHSVDYTLPTIDAMNHHLDALLRKWVHNGPIANPSLAPPYSKRASRVA